MVTVIQAMFGANAEAMAPTQTSALPRSRMACRDSQRCRITAIIPET